VARIKLIIAMHMCLCWYFRTCVVYIGTELGSSSIGELLTPWLSEHYFTNARTCSKNYLSLLLWPGVVVMQHIEHPP
jgi:hypothetical protein